MEVLLKRAKAKNSAFFFNMMEKVRVDYSELKRFGVNHKVAEKSWKNKYNHNYATLKSIMSEIRSMRFHGNDIIDMYKSYEKPKKKVVIKDSFERREINRLIVHLMKTRFKKFFDEHLHRLDKSHPNYKFIDTMETTRIIILYLNKDVPYALHYSTVENAKNGVSYTGRSR